LMALQIKWRIVEHFFRNKQRRFYGGIAFQQRKSGAREDRPPLPPPRKRGPTPPASAILGRLILAIHLRFIPAGHVRSCRPGTYRSPGYPRGTADNGRP